MQSFEDTDHAPNLSLTLEFFSNKALTMINFENVVFFHKQNSQGKKQVPAKSCLRLSNANRYPKKYLIAVTQTSNFHPVMSYVELGRC
jgi:hypothetical protein